MKDIVVKTVLITLASILGVILLIFCALSIFSPLTLAELFDRTGGYSSSIRFYEKHYDKTGDIKDLAVLALKVNEDLDAENAEQYLGELVNHDGFSNFCASQEGGELSNKEFYLGKYVVALVRNSKFDDALEVANSFVSDNGYTSLSPYSVLLLRLGEELSQERLISIKTKIQAYSGEGLENATADIEYIEQLLQK